MGCMGGWMPPPGPDLATKGENASRNLHGSFTGKGKKFSWALLGPAGSWNDFDNHSHLGVSQTPANSDSSLNPVMFVDLVQFLFFPLWP